MESRPRMQLKRQAIVMASAMAATFAAVESAAAHPHVFAEARLDVILSEDHQSVKALRHLWRFDDLFSSTVMMEFDKNSDLKLDDKELKDVADTVHASLAEFNYFQLVTVDGTLGVVQVMPINAGDPAGMAGQLWSGSPWSGVAVGLGVSIRV